MTTSTILQYNGVRLQNVQTLSFIETPVHDSSGINYLYTKTALKVVGFFTLEDHKTLGVMPNYSIYPGNGQDRGASQQFASLKMHLEQPRRRLVYSTLCEGSVQQQVRNGADQPFLDPAIGYPIFVISPAKTDAVDEDENLNEIDARTDVHGGPYPKEVNVTHVANNSVWRVEFTVEFATTPQCNSNPNYPDTERVPGETINPEDPLDDQNYAARVVEFTSIQKSLGVLGNRWSCIDRINENGFTTRTYTGSLTLANPNWNPNDFRTITVPPIVPGMVRKSIEYVTSEDNLSLRYVVTDEEVTITPPDPARTIRIMHNEADYEGGAKVSFTVRVVLTTDRKGNLYRLMLLASAIVDQRLFLGQAIDANNRASVFIQRFEYTTEQGSDQNHSVTLICSGERHPIPNKNGDVGIPEIARRAQTMSRSLAWRPVRDNNNVPLASYNNVLSNGNRPGERPDTEGGIPAISVLHAKLTTPCSTSFDVEESVPTSTEVTQRIRRIDDIEATQTGYNNDDLYEAYPIDITVEINDNLANEPIVPSPYTYDYSQAHTTFIYSHYNITSTYGNKALVVPLPVARTNGYFTKNSVAVAIGPTQKTRKIRIESERVGTPPRLPDPVAYFTEAADSYGDGDVINTLIGSKVEHLHPAPVADGTTLMYTSYMELEYSQDSAPAKHRFCIPDYINPTTSGGTVNSLTDTTKYSFPLASIFVASTLQTAWNT